MSVVKKVPAITVTCETGGEHAGFLERYLRAACRHVEKAPATISVAIVDAATMSRLHEQFLGKRESTDVLSFEVERDAAGKIVEGEIVMCLPVAEEEARGRGHPVQHELLLYAVHGLLHLSGYDDVDEAASKRMHAMEDQILRRIKIGPVFDPVGE